MSGRPWLSVTFLVALATAATAAVPVPQGRTELTLPFAGRWRVVWGGTTVGQNYHGKYWDFARYAYDFVALDAQGRTYRDQGRRVTDYVGYGQPILAPADGEVIDAVDGRPDQSLQVAPASDAVANRVQLRHATGEVSELLHLQPGSVAVQRGQRVQRGQVIGRCGNSGYSYGPHLHFNLFRRHGGQVECLLASFVWLWVRRPDGEREWRRRAPVRGDTVWSSSWASLLTQPSARPFHVEAPPGRIILTQP